MDVLFKTCRGILTVTITENGVPDPGWTVTGTLFDRTDAIVPEVSDAGFTDGGDGSYVYAVVKTFNPPAGVCALKVKATKGDVELNGIKFIDAQELAIA